MVRAMLIRKVARSGLFLSAALSLTAALALGTTGCGGKKEPQTVADLDIKAGAMPDGGEWRGVYYNQLYGFLHITESGGAVQGAWRTEAGDKWGELYGEVEGDLLRYSWTEHKIGVVGPNADSKGKGFFKYTVPDPAEPHVIKGQWGLGEVEVGHTWDALKQLNQEPDPKSVRPDELEGHSGVEGFDGNKSDTGVDFAGEEGKDGEEGKGKEGKDGAESKEKDEKAKK